MIPNQLRTDRGSTASNALTMLIGLAVVGAALGVPAAATQSSSPVTGDAVAQATDTDVTQGWCLPSSPQKFCPDSLVGSDLVDLSEDGPTGQSIESGVTMGWCPPTSPQKLCST